MKILIATDKFKDSLTALQACEGLQKGILQTFPEAQCELLPLADGGEGTLEALQSVWNGTFVTIEVHDPLFRKIQSQYLWIESTQTAIIEMARASGIELLTHSERNCLQTSTFGTGELIKNAVKKGAKNIVLTVGGSATNDAGVGMASALGYKFLDATGEALSPIGQNMTNIHQIKVNNISPLLAKINFTVATDVTNPFYGKNGAAFVFSPQKGADSQAVEVLDSGLKNLATLCEKQFGKDLQTYAGSGAGGGIGGGAVCFLNAKIVSAADWILEVNQVAKKLANTDVLITGEGKIDSQTWQGKLISRLVNLADKAQKPVFLVCGMLQDVEMIASQKAVWYASSIINQPVSLEDALENAPQLIQSQGMLLGKLLKKIGY